MPWSTQWVKPATLLKHGRVTVYRTYKYGDVESLQRKYGFTLDPQCGEDECSCGEGACVNTFDVRELANWKEADHPPFLCGRNDTKGNRAAWNRYEREKREPKWIAKMIREALDRGLLVVGKGIVKPPGEGPVAANRPKEQGGRA